MFDYHMHSTVSFDGHDKAQDMVRAAAAAGMKEICFTDHVDDDPKGIILDQCFDPALYTKVYDSLEPMGVKVRRGLEFGMLAGNQATLQRYLSSRPFDFVLGSLHYAADEDVYYPPYWQGRDAFSGERRYLEDLLQCVEQHDGFDVLGHLTYISKAPAHPTYAPVVYGQHREVVDAILEVLVRKGKGMEINTSGVDRCGVFLPARVYLERFRELGGRIITVGSDAHTASRVGQYIPQALELAKDVFGYVCTFENRQPVFHKL